MKSQDALLIDAGTGNLFSVYNALCYLGYNIQMISTPERLSENCRVILPGVGAFGRFMNGLREKGFVDAITESVKRGNPLLGICVGMQAFFETGEEMGSHPGLGLLSGVVKRFPENINVKIPHNGWNQIWFQRSSQLFKTLNNGDYVFFNHSFYCDNKDDEDIIACTDYGIQYTSMVQKGLLFGVQFHPEKSQSIGLKILDNFMKVKN